MRGVSIPSHQYAVSAQRWLDSRQNGENNRLAAIQKTLLASSCRAYTRVVLRLRAQAEAEAEESFYQCTPPQSTTSVNVAHGRRTSSRSRSMSRPASPTSSAGYVNSRAPSTYSGHHPRRPTSVYSAPSVASSQFRSPLFRVGHAPLLRVFVPNAEGEWLSDQSVIDCEKELKRAGVLPLLRIGDVVWDTAVGDEGNVGRMIWDGNYLVVRSISLHSSTPVFVTSNMRPIGSRLHVLPDWRNPSIISQPVFPTFVLSSYYSLS